MKLATDAFHMTTSLSPQDFLRVVRQSGLVNESTLARIVEEAQQQDEELATASAIGEILVGQHVLTPWQCQKMMEGRHRGFFLGKYRLLSLLGKGGMSSVYLAEHMVMHRQCAIKVLPSNRVDDASYLARFEREAQAVAALDHPNIVRAYDVDYQQSGKQRIHYLVMEYINGRELNSVVKSSGPLGFQLAADLIRQSADGLAHAHHAGLVHRDIKPSNLLVDTGGTVKILDLGLARMYTDSDTGSVTVDNEQKVLGTIDYLAPEQALNSHEVDARADIYGLGCTFYFLLAGHPPFTEGTIAQRIMAHQSTEPPALDTLRPDIPPRIKEIAQRMMVKQREQRYQTAHEVSADLAAWLGQQTDMHAADAVEPFSNLVLEDRPAVEFPTDLSFDDQNASPLEPEAVVKFLANLSASGDLDTSGGKHHAENAPLPPAEPVDAPAPPIAPAVPVADDVGIDSEVTIAVPAFTAAGQSDTTSPQQSAETIVAKPISDPDTPAMVEPNSVAQTDEHIRRQSTNQIPELITAAPDERRPSYRRRPSGDRKRTIIAGIAGLFTVVIIFGLYQMMKGPDAGHGNSDESPIQLKPIMVVGDEGDFDSIKEAIAFVKDNFLDTKWDEQVIQVSAGTYQERIQITHTPLKPFPVGVRLSAQGKVVLNPEGPEPVIQLQDVLGLTIEGFTVEAGARPTVIELSGLLTGSHLRELVLPNLKQTGILGEKLSAFRGDKKELTLQNIVFQGTARTAQCIRLVPMPNKPEYINFVDCKFLGPFKSAIDLGDYSNGLRIYGNIFSNGGVGIFFSGISPAVVDIQISNNSFYECANGIAFSEHPAALSSNLKIQRNLFAKLKGSEISVEDGLNIQEFQNIFSGVRPVHGNWTSRPKPPVAGLDIITPGGRWSVADFVFRSTDPKHEHFLAPSSTSPHRLGGQRVNLLRPVIGAIEADSAQ